MPSPFEIGMGLLMNEKIDPNEEIPLSNRPATAFGATIPFHIICWAAVIFRLHTKFWGSRDAGWDDYLIIIGLLFNTLSFVTMLLLFKYGFGTHLGLIYRDHPENFVTCFVKLSLLARYLRMFKEGILRKICIAVMVLASIWTVYWIFASWFCCFPVRGYWYRTMTPTPKCWGLGYADIPSVMASMYAFGGTNMFLDTVIFIIPMSLFFRPGMSKKKVIALISLFTLGSIVVLMAIIRLWVLTTHRGGDIQRLDFTWWFPLLMIISAIEVDFAIITASIPIFWPVIVSSLPQIFVTHEVHITRHERLPDQPNGGDFEMDRPNSLKSNNSQEGLTWKQANSKTDYNDSFVLDHVTGKAQENGRVEIQVQQAKAGKWAH